MILIIEDDNGIVDLLSEIISDIGNKSIAFNNAEDALLWLENNNPIFMIVDYSLPDMNAKEFIYKLETKRENIPPFIISTGQGDERIAVEMMKIGASDYIIKDKNFIQIFPDIIKRTLKDIENQNKIKHTEKALRESEQHFRNLADSGSVLIWTSDVDKKCNYFNLPWLNYTGRKLKEEIGDGWLENIHSEDLDYCKKTYEVSFDKRSKFSMEYRLRNASGEYRWFRDDGNPRYDSEGCFIGYIGYCIDITERKNTEEELFTQASLQQLLMELASNFINISLEKVDMAINEALEKIADFVGADRSYIFDFDCETNLCTNTYEYCKKNISSHIGNLNAVLLDVRWVEEFNKGNSILINDVAMLNDGNEKDFLLSQEIKTLYAIPLISNKICVGFVGFDYVTKFHSYSEKEKYLLKVFAEMLLNINYKIKTELIVNQQSELFNLITQTSMDGFWMVDLNGKILDVNDEYCKLTGYSKEELINHSVSKVEALEDELETKKHMEKLILLGYDKFETKHKCKNGEILEFEVSTTFSKKLNCFLAFFNDITERKKNENDLITQLNEINRFNRLMIGREEKMIELKKEINELLKELGREKKYDF